MKQLFLALFLIVHLVLPAQQGTGAEAPAQGDVEAHFAAHPDDGRPSKAVGTVGSGSLVNGKIVPFSGPNFVYFDQESYLHSRCFLHHAALNTVLSSYQRLEQEAPGRRFTIMECANEQGGKLFPHRTHQNGMSVDFMMPLVRNGAPCYDLDKMGAGHYWLSFDDQGRYSQDAQIRIDFDLVAQHILILDEEARRNGLKVEKVLIKIELKDELYATPHGKILKERGIYLARELEPLINSLHDDHFHVDFAPLR